MKADLPCEVGQRFFATHCDDLGFDAKDIEPCHISQIHIKATGTYIDVGFPQFDRVVCGLSPHLIGDVMFRTYVEAKKALEEEKNEQRRRIEGA